MTAKNDSSGLHDPLLVYRKQKNRLNTFLKKIYIFPMNSSFGLALLFMAVAIVIIILVFRGMASSASRKRQKPAASGPKSVCPVCCTPLGPGENLVTKVYKGSSINEKNCSIYGCPHCYPVPFPGKTRSCPVCKATLLPSSYLVAHLFVRDETKNHVLVSGCINCCRGHQEK